MVGDTPVPPPAPASAPAVDFMGTTLYPTLEGPDLAADALIEGECYAWSESGEHWHSGYYGRECALDDAHNDYRVQSVITARVTAVGLVDLDVSVDETIEEPHDD